MFVFKSVTIRENCIWELQIICKRPTFEQISLHRYFLEQFQGYSEIEWKIRTEISPMPSCPPSTSPQNGALVTMDGPTLTRHHHAEPVASLRAHSGCGQMSHPCPPQSTFTAPQAPAHPACSIPADLHCLQTGAFSRMSETRGPAGFSLLRLAAVA